MAEERLVLKLGFFTLPRALREIPFMPRTGEERPVPDRLDEGVATPRELGEREKLLILKDEGPLCIEV